MAGSNGDRTQVHVWVEPKTKERWTEHVESSVEHSSLSGLIRRAVEREIESGGSGGSHPGVEGDDVGGSGAIPGALETTNERIGEVLDAVSALDRRIDGLDDDVRGVRSSLELASEDSLDDLAQLVYAELPKSETAAERVAYSDPDPDEPTGNIAELSERFNVPESRINDALDRLKEQMPGMIDVFTVTESEGRYGHYYSG